ncbi:MAG: hypothetical protein J6C46_09445 [Clostridia bacterium]|nr:hypothetical protein [Clostridia bacterium]
MWVEKKIDNLIEILGANEYTKIDIAIVGDVTTVITLDYPKFEYIKSKRQIKFYNSKDTVVINVWASCDIMIDNQNMQYQILLECDESITLKMYLN